MGRTHDNQEQTVHTTGSGLLNEFGNLLAGEVGNYVTPPVYVESSSALINEDVSIDTTANIDGIIIDTYTGDSPTSKPITSGVGSIDMTQAFNGTGYYLDRSGGIGTEVFKNDAGVAQTTDLEGAFALNNFVTRVHIKSTSDATTHLVFDGLRGVGQRIYTDLPNAESFNITSLESFDVGGFTLGASNNVNGSLRGYVYYQEVYTHWKYIHNGGDFELIVYNPITRLGMSIRKGINAVKQAWRPFKVDYQETKQLNSTSAGNVFYGDADYALHLYSSTGSIAKAITNRWNNTLPTNDTFTFAGNEANTNQSGSLYVDYFSGDSESVEHITYQGSGASNNPIYDSQGNLLFTLNGTDSNVNASGVTYMAKVVLQDSKVVSVTFKSISASGHYTIHDYARGKNNQIYPSLSNIEASSTVIQSVIFSTTNSKFDFVTDGNNLNITSGDFIYTINNELVKESVSSATVSFVGVPDGVNWLAKEYLQNSYIFSTTRPTIGHYDKMSADDNRPIQIDGVWYQASTVGELVTNGAFDTDISGWSNGGEFTATWDAGRLKLTTLGTGSSNDGVYQNVPTVIGEEYSLGFEFEQGTNTQISIQIDDVQVGTISANGLFTYTFTANSSSTKIEFIRWTGTSGLSCYIDNVTMFAKASSLGTEYTNQPSWMPYPFMVASETPQDILVNETSLPSVVHGSATFTDFVELQENRKVLDIGTIFNDNRYVIDNPFGNEKYMDCDVKVELFFNGRWSQPEVLFNTSGFSVGVKAHSNLEGLVVQTGEDGVRHQGSNQTLDGFGTDLAGNDLSGLARLIVTYNGKAK